MRPKKPITSIAITCSALFVGAAILHGQSNTAVADAAVSIGFQNSGGATVGGGVSISFQSGGIIVTTNLPAATFLITGAATFTGSGTSGSFSNAPPGQYTIAFGDLVGYVTPNTQTRNLVVGGTITFTGTYLPLTSLKVKPASLNFSYPIGFVGPFSPETLVLSSTAGTPLSFTAAATVTSPAGGSWLSISPTAGTTGTPTGTLAVSVNLQGLAVKTYHGQITITAPGATNNQVTVPVTLAITSSSRQITLTAITGWSVGNQKTGVWEVLNAQWQGQPSGAPNSGKYYLFYAIDACESLSPCSGITNTTSGPQSVSVKEPVQWIFTGTGFCPSTGCPNQSGQIIFSDPNINSVVVPAANWKTTSVTFTPSFTDTFNYPGVPGQPAVNPSPTITIIAPDGVSSGSLPLPSPGGIISTIADRGDGQCTGCGAKQVLVNKRAIPVSAYNITKSIDGSYTPQQWDVLDFGAPKSSTQINGAHTAIITSPVSPPQQTTNPDGSVTSTYSFTIGEMNVSPGWGESPSSVMSQFVVNSSSGILTQIYSNYCWPANHPKHPQYCATNKKYAIAYYRPPAP